MILINLNPQKIAKETKKIRVPYRLIAFFVFVIFLSLSLYNLFAYIRLREGYRSYDKQWKAIAQKSAEADNLERELGASIISEVDFYDAFIDPSLETAKILNLASDLLPRSVWLNQLEFERNKKEMQLILSGLAEASGAGGLRLIEIQNFINSLKDQMEQLTSPVSQANPNSKKPIVATVVTSSQKSEANKSESIQFTATFRTEGFGQK
ncbi:MAG: hypothetical protein HY583_01125 [Candidatus Omnitrophica bacterium]|nr:hypothetical protein [Candidatus Omnitrophota bacterium]